MSFRSSFTTDLSGGGSSRASLLSHHHHRHQSISLSSPLLSGTGTSPILGTTASAAAAAAATAPLSPISRSLLLSSAIGPLADRKLPPVNTSIFANETNTTTSHHHNNWERIRLPAPLRPEAFTVPGPPRRTLPKLPSASTSRSVFRRKRFLVFIKVLLKCLKKDGIKSPHSARLFTQAKAIIADCTQRNRQKDPHYCPLPEAVELRLRPVVGEAQWKRANACLDLYLEKRRQLHRTTATTCTAPTTAPAPTAPVDPLQVSFPEICRTASWKDHL